MGKQEELFDNLKIGIVSHAHETVPFNIHANHLAVFSKWAKQYETLFIGIHGLKNAKAREILFQRAIDEGCTHVLVLDVDHIVFESMLPLLLRQPNAAMVSGLICRRSYPFNQVGFVKDDDGYYVNIGFDLGSNKTYEVDACAFGCTLINLAQLQELEKPYFRDTLTHEVEGKLYNKRSDINLCAAFKAKGKQILIDTRVKVGHMMPNQTVYPQTQGLWQQIHHLLTDHELMQTEFQVPVYALARTKLAEYSILNVLDIGCGEGKKLAAILDPHVQDIKGFDIDQAKVNECKKLMPEGSFNKVDIEQLDELFSIPNTLIMCADVLEHLNDPKALLEKIPDETLCIFSTPDVSTVGTKEIQKNLRHKHHWTKADFICFLKNKGFTILDTLHYQERLPYKGIAVVCRKEK